MSARRPDAPLPRPGSRLPRLLAVGLLAGWFTATVAGQHPQRLFDRVRRHDRIGLLVPDWRFFAPEPARHDLHVLHRVLTADGEETPWTETSRITPRAALQTFWFPSRRREKALYDICSTLTTLMTRPGLDPTRFAAYRMLAASVESAVRTEYAQAPAPRGFQFVVARSAGFDPGPELEFLFVSPFARLR
jgi:hypothetical protein